MSSGKCYIWDADNKEPVVADPNHDQPCPSGGGCCNPGDTCVGNFMCKHKEIATDPNRPDYYISACTDAKYTSSACTKFCFKYTRTGVVYNETTQLWACCGTAMMNGTLQTTCATPTNDTFSLVPPDQLPIIGIAGVPATSSTSSSSTTTSTPTSSATSQTASPSGTSVSTGGMTTGTQVGLGVGLGLGIVLLALAVAFLFIRRRKSRAGTMSESASNSSDTKPLTTSSFSVPAKHDTLPSYMRYTGGPDPHSESRLPGTIHELGEIDARHRELPVHAPVNRIELPG